MKTNYFKTLLSKNKRKTEYNITTVNVNGNIKSFRFYSIKDVDNFIIEINNEKYWNVQKIEKLRKYKFKYNKEIAHSPLFFDLENVTENDIVNNQDYSFLKKHKSLENINRVSSKGTLNEVI